MREWWNLTIRLMKLRDNCVKTTTSFHNKEETQTRYCKIVLLYQKKLFHFYIIIHELTLFNIVHIYTHKHAGAWLLVYPSPTIS